jgi:hypothetical protein
MILNRLYKNNNSKVYKNDFFDKFTQKLCSIDFFYRSFMGAGRFGGKFFREFGLFCSLMPFNPVL